MSLPKLLREARKAAGSDDYAAAIQLYEKILSFPEMKDDLDVRLRYAYCAEQIGETEKARGLYAQVIETYKADNEVTAAEDLLSALGRLDESKQDAKKASESVPEISQAELAERLFKMGIQHSLEAGEYLCHAGDVSSCMWLLKEGSLLLHLQEYDDPPDHIKAVKNGLVMVGELGLFLKHRRRVSLEAAEPVEYIQVNAKQIQHECRTDMAFEKAIERLFRERVMEPILARHAVFEKVNDVDRRRLAFEFERKIVEAGEQVIGYGEEHGGTYFLQSGCLFYLPVGDAEKKDKEEVLISVLPGEIIHLGGLLRGYQSSARVVAATRSELLHLSIDSFEPYTLRRPWIIQAILNFSRRPTHLQVMRPGDEYQWKINRELFLQSKVFENAT